MINSVLLNLLCVLILFETASSHSCFRFFFLFFSVEMHLDVWVHWDTSVLCTYSIGDTFVAD